MTSRLSLKPIFLFLISVTSTTALAQCRYVDPQQNRAGFYAWCSCIGGTPRERNGNSVCDRASADSPGDSGLFMTPGQEYRSKRYQAVGTLQDKFKQSDRNSLFARHLSQILRHLPPQLDAESLEDAYYAADELASYFDGYASAYNGKLWQLRAIDQQRLKEERMVREMESELPTLERDKADLEEQEGKLHEQLQSRKRYGEAALKFEMRMLGEKRRVGLRVLKRTHAPIPKFYAASPFNTSWDANPNLTSLVGELDCCVAVPERIPPIEYWDSYCNRIADRECHRELPDEIPDPPSYRRQEVNVTEARLEQRVREIDPSKALKFLEQLQAPSDASYNDEADVLRGANNVWGRLQSVGSRYSKMKNWINPIFSGEIRADLNLLNRTHNFIAETREESIYVATDTSFWWFLDHLMAETLKAAKSGDPEAMPHMRRIGAAAIKFANGEFDLTRQSVSALVNGDPTEIQTLQNLMQEKVCDFKTNVDNEAFYYIPKSIRSLFPPHPLCR